MELFNKYTFHPRLHGKWVRKRINEINKHLPRHERVKKWVVQGQDMWTEILRWFAANALDISRTESGAYVGRPTCALWLIPEQVLKPEARGITWDLRPFLGGNKDAIEPLSYENPDPGEWDRDLLQSWCEQSGVPDSEFAQHLYTDGVHVPFEGDKTTVLTPNSRGLQADLAFA